MYEHLTIEELEAKKVSLYRLETETHERYRLVSRLLEARVEERKLEVATDESQRKIEKLIGEPVEPGAWARFRAWLHRTVKI